MFSCISVYKKIVRICVYSFDWFSPLLFIEASNNDLQNSVSSSTGFFPHENEILNGSHKSTPVNYNKKLVCELNMWYIEC